MSINKNIVLDNYTSFGGEAIAAGGFGCVFLPPLKCKGEDRPTGKVVSKLLTKSNATSEFREAKDIQNILRTNLGEDTYKKYFIFPEKQCEPEKLTHTDLATFNAKCKNLTKHNITAENINTKLNYIGLIELTNGGKDLDGFIKKDISTSELRRFNKSAVNLLTNAIVPMNKLNVIHFDLKSGNIVMDGDYQMRIIDWGLSFIVNNHTNVASDAKNRPFQYNLPFSGVIFNKDITNRIDKHLKTLTYRDDYKNELREQIRAAVFNTIVSKYGFDKTSGHLDYIKSSLKYRFDIHSSSKEFALHSIITNYITQIVIDFVNPKTKRFECERYFHEVFIKNCDIWGLLTCYDDIVKNSKKQKSKLNENMKLLLYKYLYSSDYASKPIDVDKLVAELKDWIPFKDDKPRKMTIKVKRKKQKKVLVESIADDSPILAPPPGFSAIVKKKGKITIVDDSPGLLPAPEIDGKKANKTMSVTKKVRSKRCPNGTRRNNKTGECEQLKGKQIKELPAGVQNKQWWQ